MGKRYNPLTKKYEYIPDALSSYDGSSRVTVEVDNEPDYVYFNINLTNNNNIDTICNSIINLTSPIINDSSHYYLSVIRFVLDGSSIPIFIFKNNTYFITLSVVIPTDEGDQSFESQSPIQYNNDYSRFDLQTIYYYDDFITLINKTIAAVFVDLTAQVFAAGLSLPYSIDRAPYMIYSPATGLCGIAAQSGYAEPSDPDSPETVRIWFNNAFYAFFANLPAYPVAPDDGSINTNYLLNMQKIGISNTGLALPFIPSDEFFVSQEFPALYLWFDITTIMFVSNALGVNPEFTPVVNTSSALGTSASGGASNVTIPMLTDFQPYYAPGDAAGPRSYIYYVPQSEYRRYDLFGGPIDTVDVKIILRDRVGNQYPYYIPPFQSVQMKLCFQKRSLIKHS